MWIQRSLQHEETTDHQVQHIVWQQQTSSQWREWKHIVNSSALAATLSPQELPPF